MFVNIDSVETYTATRLYNESSPTNNTMEKWAFTSSPGEYNGITQLNYYYLMCYIFEILDQVDSTITWTWDVNDAMPLITLWIACFIHTKIVK